MVSALDVKELGGEGSKVSGSPARGEELEGKEGNEPPRDRCGEVSVTVWYCDTSAEADVTATLPIGADPLVFAGALATAGRSESWRVPPDAPSKFKNGEGMTHSKFPSKHPLQTDQVVDMHCFLNLRLGKKMERDAQIEMYLWLMQTYQLLQDVIFLPFRLLLVAQVRLDDQS